MSGRILLVEDEPVLASALADNLRIEGYTVTLAADGQTALAHLEVSQDLVILDVMLPDLDGWEVLRRLRRRGLTLPVIMLTALGDDRSRVKGLDAGADDYLSKPFSLLELLARIRARLRRHPPGLAVERVKLGERILDLQSGSISNQPGNHLSGRECDLLRLLAGRRGEVFDRTTIARALGTQDDSLRAIDMQVQRLRKKIEADPARPVHLLTVHGRGYRLV